jgi:DNA replication protein DnaC
MLHTRLDKPPDRDDFPCRLCGEPMKVSYIWVGGDHPRAHWVLNHTVHARCLKNWDAQRPVGKIVSQQVPEGFRDFDGKRIDERAMAAAAEFTCDSAKHVLAILGLPHRGKSRLMWATIQGFFDALKRTTGRSSWVSYFSFVELIAELDRVAIARIKNEGYVFVDDVGSVDSFGREKASLQAAIRARVQRNAWTFLTIDSAGFDPDLVTELRDRSTLIILDQ